MAVNVYTGVHSWEPDSNSELAKAVKGKTIAKIKDVLTSYDRFDAECVVAVADSENDAWRVGSELGRVRHLTKNVNAMVVVIKTDSYTFEKALKEAMDSIKFQFSPKNIINES